MNSTCKFVLLFPNFRLYDPFSVTPHQPSLSLGYLAGMLDIEHERRHPDRVIEDQVESALGQEAAHSPPHRAALVERNL